MGDCCLVQKKINIKRFAMAYLFGINVAERRDWRFGFNANFISTYSLVVFKFRPCADDRTIQNNGPLADWCSVRFVGIDAIGNGTIAE